MTGPRAGLRPISERRSFSRRAILLVTSVAAASFFWLGCGPASISGRRPIRVVALNLEAQETPLPIGYTGELRRILSDWQPDILLLQGLGTQPGRAVSPAEIRLLGDGLGLERAYFADPPDKESFTTIGILSRWHLVDLEQDVGNYPAASPRLLGGKIRWGGRIVRFYTMSLDRGSDVPFPFEQIQDVLPKVRDTGDTFVVGAYLGVAPETESVAFLSSEWRDAWTEAGSGLGYTTPLPVPRARHSYLFLEKGSRVRADQIFPISIPGARSGHLPLYAALILAPPQPEAPREEAMPPAPTEEAPPPGAEEPEPSPEPGTSQAEQASPEAAPEPAEAPVDEKPDAPDTGDSPDWKKLLEDRYPR